MSGSPDAGPALSARGLGKRFGGIKVTDRVDLDLRPGEIHALIGPNGAGKTTLLNQLAGELAPDKGRIFLKGRDVTRMPVHARARLGLARTYQITSIFMGLSVLENVALAIQARRGHAFRFWKPALADLRAPALSMLERLGLAPVAERPAAELSHGDQRKTAVGMTLALDPAVVLLDEPMAGMGPRSSRDMVDLIASLRGDHAVLLVEHDMDAVFSLADRISVLVHGRIIASGTPDHIRDHAEVREAYLGTEDPLTVRATLCGCPSPREKERAHAPRIRD